MSEFQKRLITGIVFIGIMIYTTQNIYFLYLIITIIGITAILELNKMVYTLDYGKILLIFGVIYILSALMAWYQLSKKEIFEFNGALLVMILTWSNDVLAYLIGKAIGKHKLAPTISPGKTWEGTLGGIFGTGIIAFFLLQGTAGVNYNKYIFLGIYIAVFATLGDLVESKLKRRAGVKDSGQILPGHGGILDRLDAMFLTMPMTWFLYYFL